MADSHEPQRLPLIAVLVLIWILGIAGGLIGFMFAQAAGAGNHDAAITAGLGSLIGMTVVYFIRRRW